MPDEVIANPSEAPATATESLDTSQPTEATPVEATSQAESEPEPESGFTAEDFKNPQYGSKVKNLYRGWQKRQTEAKQWEKKYREIEAVAKYDPEVNKALKSWWARQTGQPVKAEGTEPQKTESAPQGNDVAAQFAFNNIYAHLGSGDPIKGKEVFWKDYADDVENVSKSFQSGPEESLKIAMELINLRKQVKQSVPAAVKPATVATSERGRGATSAVSTKEKDPYELADEAAREAGYRSFAEMALGRE